MARLAVLALTLEANTFSTVRSTAALMEAERGIHRGAEIIEQYGASSTTLAGFLDPGVPEGVELVPLVSYRAGALGAFTAETFDETTADMAEMLRSQGPFDGVLLALHGAAVAENAEHADAVVAERMRAVVGPGVPIGVVLDMHANVDRRLVEAVDVLRVFQTNPHVDARERAIECRSVVLAMLQGRPRPVTAFEHLPLVVNIVKQDTADEPLAGILARCRELESTPGMMDVSIAEGFPYADVEQMGMAVIASHRDDAGAAGAAVEEIARLLWDARSDLQGEAMTVDEALQRVSSHSGGPPILLLDVGDNVGGGSSGDSTSLLNAAVDKGVGRIAMTLWDPEAVATLSSVRVGDRVSVTVGGRSAEQSGHPQRLDATLSARTDGFFEDPGPTHGGFRRYDAGPTVALRTDDGLAVVVTSHPMGNTSAELLRMVGVEPNEFAAVVGKGVNSPKAGYDAVCGERVLVDTPGVTRLSVTQLEYTRRRRPMYPFEPETSYRGANSRQASEGTRVPMRA